MRTIDSTGVRNKIIKPQERLVTLTFDLAELDSKFPGVETELRSMVARKNAEKRARMNKMFGEAAAIRKGVTHSPQPTGTDFSVRDPDGRTHDVVGATLKHTDESSRVVRKGA